VARSPLPRDFLATRWVAALGRAACTDRFNRGRVGWVRALDDAMNHVVSAVAWFVLRAILSQEAAIVVIGFVGRTLIGWAVSRLPDESRNTCSEEWLGKFEHNLASRPLKALKYAAGLHRVAPRVSPKADKNTLIDRMALLVTFLVLTSLTGAMAAFLIMLGASFPAALSGGVGFVIASILVVFLRDARAPKKQRD
jgi:hypothetical protein